VPPRNPAQFVVHERDKRLERRLITVAPGQQQRGWTCGWFANAPILRADYPET